MATEEGVSQRLYVQLSEPTGSSSQRIGVVMQEVPGYWPVADPAPKPRNPVPLEVESGEAELWEALTAHNERRTGLSVDEQWSLLFSTFPA